MTIILDLGPEIVETGYLCPCCERVFEHSDEFAMSLCWDCSFGCNGNCVRCVGQGVPFHEFQKGKKMHRLAKPTSINDTWRAVCGYQVPSKSIGMATAVIFDYCKHCWKED